MSSNALEISRLSFAYDSRLKILDEVSLTIPHGQVVAVMGGSGSGKTTLLRNICGQVSPTADSEIVVLGQRLAGLSQHQMMQLRRHVGVLFQFGGLFTDLSIFDNVAFPLREHFNLSTATIRDIVMLKLEGVGLARFRPSVSL